MRFPNFILVVMVAVVTHGHETGAQNSVLESLTHEETTMSYFVLTSGTVYHLEEDQFIPGNILFIDGYSIKTSDGKTTSIVVGNATSSGNKNGEGENARLGTIYNFLQLAPDQVVIPDYSFACLKLLNRTTGNTTEYAGKCGYSGTVTFGKGSRLPSPRRVIRDNRMPHHLLISTYSASYTDSLVHFNMESGIMSPFGSINRPNGMMQTENGNLIYTAQNNQRVEIFNYKFKFVDRLAGYGSAGYSDGNSTTARFYNPAEVILINQTKTLIADRYNNRIRVLDLTTNFTTTFCSGTPKECHFNKPYSLLISGNSLLIGEPGRIVKVNGHGSAGVQPNKISGTTGESGCPKEIVKKAPGTVGYSMVDIFLADGSPVRLQLPPGVYPIEYKTNDTNCTDISITVSAFDEKVVRRLAFRAEYDVKCSSIADEVSQSSLRSISNHNYGQLEEVVCQQDCMRAKGAAPMTQCDSNTLTVQWPTDLTFSGSADKVPSDVAAKLNKRLIEKGNFLYVFLLQQVPPIVYPRVTAEGASVTLELISSCTAGYTYNMDKDSCTKN